VTPCSAPDSDRPRAEAGKARACGWLVMVDQARHDRILARANAAYRDYQQLAAIECDGVKYGDSLRLIARCLDDVRQVLLRSARNAPRQGLETTWLAVAEHTLGQAMTLLEAVKRDVSPLPPAADPAT